MAKISVTILTKDSSRYLYEVLEALSSFDEIVILDNGSSDNTIEIASSFTNVKVYKHEFIGFGPLKNLAVDYASNDWILSIDSDEIVPPALIMEIDRLELNEKCIYSIPRDNYYKEQKMRCCGWEGDVVKRLFNRKYTRFNDNLVHESIIDTNMSQYELNSSIQHYSFDSAEELVAKMQKYSTLYAKDYKGRKKSSPSKAFIRATFAFFKYYILKKGFLNGYEGLLISVSNANGVFYKYIKLYEENQK
jgi:glycosyltransferase involved in cell wall biosynthesis